MRTRPFAVLPLLAAMTLGYVTIGCEHDRADDGHQSGYSQQRDYDHARYDDHTDYDRHQYDRDFH